MLTSRLRTARRADPRPAARRRAVRSSAGPASPTDRRRAGSGPARPATLSRIHSAASPRQPRPAGAGATAGRQPTTASGSAGTGGGAPPVAPHRPVGDHPHPDVVHEQPAGRIRADPTRHGQLGPLPAGPRPAQMSAGSAPGRTQVAGEHPAAPRRVVGVPGQVVDGERDGRARWPPRDRPPTIRRGRQRAGRRALQRDPAAAGSIDPRSPAPGPAPGDGPDQPASSVGTGGQPSGSVGGSSVAERGNAGARPPRWPARRRRPTSPPRGSPPPGPRPTPGSSSDPARAARIRTAAATSTAGPRSADRHDDGRTANGHDSPGADDGSRRANGRRR